MQIDHVLYLCIQGLQFWFEAFILSFEVIARVNDLVQNSKLQSFVLTHFAPYLSIDVLTRLANFSLELIFQPDLALSLLKYRFELSFILLFYGRFDLARGALLCRQDFAIFLEQWQILRALVGDSQLLVIPACERFEARLLRHERSDFAVLAGWTTTFVRLLNVRLKHLRTRLLYNFTVLSHADVVFCLFLNSWLVF